MRLFVAIAVPPLSTHPAEAVPPSVEHLTLRFLGEVPAERIPSIAEALTGVGRVVAPFDLRLEGVGAFPTRSNPRVVWVGVTTGREEVTELAGRVREALAAEVPPTDSDRFVPHVTLFRVRSPRSRQRAFDLLAGTEPAPLPCSSHVTEFVLVESTLSSRGALHRTLAAFPLNGRPAPVG